MNIGHQIHHAIDGSQCPVERRSPREGARLRVLIAEDDLDQGAILYSIVTSLGHESHTVSDGLAAVFSASQLQPDVILMDIGMPRLDGYEATRQIRALTGYPTIVALSVWNREADLKLSAAAGMNHHLVKPLDVNALVSILQYVQAKKIP
jgi:CheY-like chemotaxis protein